jgi:hypothetical protein
MRLNEIKSIEADLPEIISQMQSKRTFAIASGTNAVALIFPDKKYIYRVWKTDAEYEAFLEYAIKHPHENIVKVLSKIRTVQTKSGVLKFVKLEKLEPLINGALAAITAMANAVDGNGYAGENVTEFIEMICDEADDSDAVLKFLKKHKKFLKLCMDFVDRAWDNLNPNNIMMRGKTLVIIDPAFDQNTVDEYNVPQILGLLDR